ncbi:protein DMR6-LIKE OXYGENASE 1 [Beta vulgaris subsp. vulgaris]|uniref:protein DMR6-LIKE OXYGENASE 1 n=1 Tax=Beta vulgaris subsp. vulgaris TaxID=3555 RepID=UPI002036CC7D|nr:protein DMR6-LIKE OXYGENASE 1 [Beta vulgaris subsp. vulgaris]
MMQSNCYGACSNFSLLNGYRRRPLPYTNISISKVLTKKISATTGSVFKWANSEDNDSSSLALTPNFILPVERRPNLTEVSKSVHKVPIIDMASGELDSHIEEIANACEDYGLFLIKNHGVPQELCDSMLSAATDLFHLPPETKALLVSDNPAKDVRICNHYRKVEGKDDKKPQRFSMWSELFKHPWHPTDDSFAALLPSDPPDYRKVITMYAAEIGILMSRLLNLMSKGLGLEGNYLQDRLGKNPLCRVQANYYPPCTNPDLTLGMGVHTDRDAITILLPSPNVQGLQIMKDNECIDVDPVPNALVVNIGDQLQVLSNGKYKSVLHRVVTNRYQSRVSLAMFYGPDKDAVMGPIEDLIDEQHPPLYRNYYFREFLEEFRNQEGKNRKVKEYFEI